MSDSVLTHMLHSKTSKNVIAFSRLETFREKRFPFVFLYDAIT